MTSQLHSYYRKLPPSIGQQFRNLDEDSVYEESDRALRSPSTRNFVVDFGGAPEDNGQAWCAVDINPDDEEGIRALLSSKRPENGQLRTRWINIFSPYEERNLVSTITQFYNFSPRLTNVITTPPVGPPRSPSEPPPSRPVSLRSRLFNRGDSRDVEASPSSTRSVLNDLFNPAKDVEMIRSRRTAAVVRPGDHAGNYMDLVQNVWHFHAVEWGGRYICTGFNHLHQVPNAKKETSNLLSKNIADDTDSDSDSDVDERRDFDKGDYAPEGRRLWSWLILCDDGTVISIHEPFGPTSGDSLQKIRRNLLAVFRSLSASPLATSSPQAAVVGGGLDDLPFRMPSHDLSNISGGPSLLMYYLFDDWHSIYSFVLGAGHPYSTQMRTLRNEMHADPRLTHLARLNHITRQLAILRRMYETRKIILENILYRHENSSRSARTFHGAHTGSHTRSPSPDDFTHPHSMGNPHVLGVKLHDLAITKFERLRDRIRLYVLGELDALLVEKQELENLTFNLISLKQAGTIELLTRVTIWLTLFTFLCLPLTLVTGYFSMQLKDVEGVYDLKAFWGTAGVSIAITIIVLWTVAKVGGAEAGVLWRGFRNFWGGWGSVKRRRKTAKRRQN